MKSLAVIILINMSLCGVFIMTNGLSCYECKWKDEKCATETNEAKLKKITCGAVLYGLGDENGTTVAPGPAPPGPVPPVKGSTPAPGGVFHCFTAVLKPSGIVRGCKATDKTDDCVVGAVVSNCTICDKDNCNGQSIITGSKVQCALVSSLVIARMFFITK